jgi:hypothetical protein
VGASPPQAIATAAIRRSPPATAAATALRSAQFDSGYDAFSTFTPAKIRPPASTAAPTGNRL